MWTFVLVFCAFLLCVLINAIICVIFIQEEDSVFNTLVIMVTNNLVPFVIGCAVGFYVIGNQIWVM